MDVELLIANLGPSFLTGDLYSVLKCPKCKSRKFLFMLTPVHFSYGDVRRHTAKPLLTSDALTFPPALHKSYMSKPFD